MNHARAEGCDVGAKPEDSVWRSIQKIGGLSKCQDGRYSPSECHLTNTDPVLDPRQALEHYKPPTLSFKMHLNITLCCALGR
jgi:hypothetical protein